MNRTDAKRIAETVTGAQLAVMFERAKVNIQDWTKPSSVNPHMTRGKAWNVLYPCLPQLAMHGRIRKMVVQNMLHEFGDFLDEELKPTTADVKRHAIEPLHEEPVFEVAP